MQINVVRGETRIRLTKTECRQVDAVRNLVRAVSRNANGEVERDAMESCEAMLSCLVDKYQPEEKTGEPPTESGGQS